MDAALVTTLWNNHIQAVEHVVSDEVVGQACNELFGAGSRNWAKLTRQQICTENSAHWNGIVPTAEAKKLAEFINALVDEAGSGKGKLTELYGQTGKIKTASKAFDEYLNKGHLDEFQYAIQVELEHGVVNGANVTNNHPLFTALIVLSHLTEDPLYYARLWLMEVTAELRNAQLHGEPAGVIEPLSKERQRAKSYLEYRKSHLTPWR